jgi:hypothetical protein
MTFEEYKKKKQAEISAFKKYQASKTASNAAVPKVEQTVKVSTVAPVLPTIKVSNAPEA